MATAKHYDYDIAISFAGEDREYAKSLAEALKSRNVKVFYDQYEKSTLWGKNLYTHLSEVYQNKARYCIMFLSQHYATKLWTNHEREAAQARAFKEHEEYILPIRLDDTEIPGVLPSIAYLKWPPETAETIVEIILAKLNITASKTKQQWLDEGDTYYQAKQCMKALRAYEMANELDPSDPIAIIGRGKVLYNGFRQYEYAEECFQEAIHLDPHNAEAYYQLAILFDHSTGNREKALILFDKVTQLDPNNADAYSRLGYWLADYGRHDEALAALEKAIHLDPQHPSAYLTLGKVLNYFQRYDEALAALEKTAQWLLSSEDCLFARAASLRGLGNIEEAKKLERIAYSYMLE